MLMRGAWIITCRLLTMPHTWLSEPCRKMFITAFPAKHVVELASSESPAAATA